jgi:hypothetical protein
VFVPHSLFQLLGRYWVELAFVCVDYAVVGVGWDSRILAGFEANILGNEGRSTLSKSNLTSW